MFQVQRGFSCTDLRLRPKGPLRKRLREELAALLAVPKPSPQQQARIHTLKRQLEGMAGVP